MRQDLSPAHTEALNNLWLEPDPLAHVEAYSEDEKELLCTLFMEGIRKIQKTEGLQYRITANSIAHLVGPNGASTVKSRTIASRLIDELVTKGHMVLSGQLDIGGDHLPVYDLVDMQSPLAAA